MHFHIPFILTEDSFYASLINNSVDTFIKRAQVQLVYMYLRPSVISVLEPPSSCRFLVARSNKQNLYHGLHCRIGSHSPAPSAHWIVVRHKGGGGASSSSSSSSSRGSSFSYRSGHSDRADPVLPPFLVPCDRCGQSSLECCKASSPARLY